MRYLRRNIVVSECRNKADDSSWEAKTHRHQIRVAYWWKFYQSIGSSANLLNDSLISKGIEHVARDSVLDSLAHTELATA